MKFKTLAIILGSMMIIGYIIGLINPEYTKNRISKEEKPQATNKAPESTHTANKIVTPTPGSYTIINIDRSPDRYGQAIKVYAILKDKSQLDNVNNDIILKYFSAGVFSQVFYYSDQTMSNRLAVYTFNPTTKFVDLTREWEN